MSSWTHSICDACWQLREPDREPVRVRDNGPRECCYCGQIHRSGIYVRGDPSGQPCWGSRDRHMWD